MHGKKANNIEYIAIAVERNHLLQKDELLDEYRNLKGMATITDDDLDELSDELSEMYPMAIAVYYEECIRSIREKAMKL